MALAARCLLPAGLLGSADADATAATPSSSSPPPPLAGAEVWCQVYEGGRGLDPHWDKDEADTEAGRRTRHPQVSSIVYLTGGDAAPSSGGTHGATCVLNQRLHPRAPRAVPAAPTAAALLRPEAGAGAAVDGRLLHSVLASSPGVVRATLLVNWWAGRGPTGVSRAPLALPLAPPLPAAALARAAPAVPRPLLRVRLPPAAATAAGNGFVALADLVVAAATAAAADADSADAAGDAPVLLAPDGRHGVWVAGVEGYELVEAVLPREEGASEPPPGGGCAVPVFVVAGAVGGEG